MARNKFRWPALGLLIGLLLVPVLGAAITFLRDDGGTAAPLCSFLDSAGVPAYCASANPLPVTSGGLTAASDPTGFGKKFQHGLAPAAAYLVNVDVTGMLLDSINAVMLGPTAGNLIRLSISGNSGRTFTVVGDSTTTAARLVDMLRLPSGVFLVAGQNAAVASMVFSSVNLITYTSAVGLPAASTVNAIKQNAGTVLATTSTGDICRSTDSGANFACVNPAIFTTFDRQSVTAVTTGVWLAMDSIGVVGRSTDDGTTWASVTTDTPGGAFTTTAVTCLTSTVCLASGGQRVLRSVDAGLTWTIVLPTLGAGNPQRIAGFANFGAGVVAAVLNPSLAAVQILCYRSIDFGAEWDLCAPPVTTSIGGSLVGINSVSVSGGSGFYMLPAQAAQPPQPVYSVGLGGGQTQVVGELGAVWRIDANGSGPVIQGNNTLATAPTIATFPWLVSPPTLSNGTNLTGFQTSGANAVNTVTLTGVANTRIYLYHVSAFCSAGTATLSIAGDGAVVKWQGPAAGVPAAPAIMSQAFDTPIQNFTISAGQNMVITVTACGVGNTSTVNQISMRF